MIRIPILDWEKFTPWLLLVTVVMGCSPRVERQPGICLSFDDRNLEQWVEVLPLLKENDARATFFLNGVGSLSPTEKKMIRQIQDEGHDIQSHGEYHFSMNSYISDKGLFSYLEKEITENLEAFKELGISPTVFAYPFGEKNHYIDLFLWTKFSATRDVASKKDNVDQMDEIFYKLGEVRFNFISLAIDDDQKIPNGQLERAFRRAQSNNEAMLVHAHEIGGNGNLRISKDRLKWFLETGRKSGLKFYKYSELMN